MSDYKLTYFNLRARGETTRMMFHLGGQKFEDRRSELKDFGPEDKLNTPFGQLPVLEVDGQVFCQSRTIERLIAKRMGLYGDNDLTQAKADMIVDSMEDMIQPMGELFFAPDDKKPELRKKYLDEKAPGFIQNLEKMVDPAGYFNGSKLTWPDISCFNMLTNIGDMGIDLSAEMVKAPKLKSLMENVKKNPKIAAWIAKRPKTDV